MANSNPSKEPKDPYAYSRKMKEYAASLRGKQGVVKEAVSEELWLALERAGISQAELARRAEVKPQYITKVFRGTTNFTLETMVALFFHLGLEMEVNVKPRCEMSFPWEAVWTQAGDRALPQADPRQLFKVPLETSSSEVADDEAIAS